MNESNDRIPSFGEIFKAMIDSIVGTSIEIMRFIPFLNLFVPTEETYSSDKY